ncbi:AsmA-like C-terminal region-containing protein [Flavobacteriales bacterium]|nr:AsmA-like C-terminal region-containing protein [Flavobacteriales bacterium]
MKRIFQTLVGVSLLFLVSGLMITFFFSEKVETAVVTKMNEQIISDLQLGEVSFSLYKKFPSASVKITDLLAFEKEGFNNDTLFYAKTTYIELSIFDILFNKIDIKKVIVDEGRIHIKYNLNRKPNFTIFKTIEGNNNNVKLKKILLLNTSVKYQTKNIDIDCQTRQAILIPQEEKLSINATLFSKKLKVHDQDYINKKNVRLLTTLSLKKDSIFIYRDSRAHIEDVIFELYGSILQGNTIDLDFSCKNQKIAEVMNNTPLHLSSIYKSFQANGELSCKGNIKGLISKESNPALNMSYSIDKGDFTLKSKPFILKNMSLDGKITNGDDRNFQKTKIEITQFDAKTESGFIKGNFIIQDLNQYYLTANLNSSWDLAEINHYFEDSPFFNLEGELLANTEYAGHISFDNRFQNYFLNAQHNSSASFKNTYFNYKSFPLKFNVKSADCKFQNNTINIANSSLTIADSDLNFNGNITNLIRYILKKKDEIYITGDLRSTYIKFDELLTLKDLSESKNTDAMPNWINATLNTNVTTFSYNEFIASDITGELSYHNLTLSGKDLLLNSLNGNIIGNFKLYESNNKLKLFSEINLNKLNIRNSFLAFNNFNQDFITAEHLKGVGTAEIQVEASWKPGLIFEKDRLKVKSHLVIEKGELIQFKPLETLSDYVSLDDLKEVQFSTLENTIEIENSIITIPNMEIKSSALSVFLSGTHTFEQKIDYSIKLLLSELLSNRFRKKNTAINNEFGEVEEEGQIFTTIYLKMTGNTNNPIISFDGVKIKEDIQESIDAEIETIKTIIKEDILKIEESSEKEQGQDIIIEWEDEEKYNPK